MVSVFLVARLQVRDAWEEPDTGQTGRFLSLVTASSASLEIVSHEVDALNHGNTGIVSCTTTIFTSFEDVVQRVLPAA